MFPSIVLQIIAEYTTYTETRRFYIRDHTNEGWRVEGVANLSGTRIWVNTERASTYKTEVNVSDWRTIYLADWQLPIEERYIYPYNEDGPRHTICRLAGNLLVHRGNNRIVCISGDDGNVSAPTVINYSDTKSNTPILCIKTNRIDQTLFSSDCKWCVIDCEIAPCKSNHYVPDRTFMISCLWPNGMYRTVRKHRRLPVESRIIGFSPDSSSFFHMEDRDLLVRTKLYRSPLVI